MFVKHLKMTGSHKLPALSTVFAFLTFLSATFISVPVFATPVAAPGPKKPLISPSLVPKGKGLECPLLPGCPNGLSVPLPPLLKKSPVTSAPAPAIHGSNLVEGKGKYKGMILVPAGPFEMGSPDTAGRVDEQPVHKVFLKNFYIARHEVTVRDFCRFLNEKGPIGKNKRPRVNLSSPFCPVVRRGNVFVPKKGMADRPMVGVSWYAASDYARWAGGRLPTSAEWEKAALLSTPYPPGDYLTILTRKSSLPVSIAAPGVRGITGLIGNAWEWCSDWYQRDYYQQSVRTNPVGPSLGDEKEIRGGSWASVEASKRVKNRHRAPPQGFYRTVGIRIVKD